MYYIDASPEDIARGLSNSGVDWNKVDAGLDAEYAEHERKVTEHEQNAE